MKGYEIRNLDTGYDTTEEQYTSVVTEGEAYYYQIFSMRHHVEAHHTTWKQDPAFRDTTTSMIARVLGVTDTALLPNFPKFIVYLAAMDIELKTWEREGLVTVDEAAKMLDTIQFGLTAPDHLTATRDLAILLANNILTEKDRSKIDMAALGTSGMYLSGAVRLDDLGLLKTKDPFFKAATVRTLEEFRTKVDGDSGIWNRASTKSSRLSKTLDEAISKIDTESTAKASDLSIKEILEIIQQTVTWQRIYSEIIIRQVSNFRSASKVAEMPMIPIPHHIPPPTTTQSDTSKSTNNVIKTKQKGRSIVAASTDHNDYPVQASMTTTRPKTSDSHSEQD